MNNSKWQRQVRKCGINIDSWGPFMDTQWYELRKGELYWLGEYRPGYRNALKCSHPYVYVGSRLHRGKCQGREVEKMTHQFMGPEGIIEWGCYALKVK